MLEQQPGCRDLAGLPATDGQKDVPRICPLFARGGVPAKGRFGPWKCQRVEAPQFCARLARGKPRAVAQRKVQFSLLLERYWTQGWWKAVSGLAAEPGLTPCSTPRPTSACITGAAETESLPFLPLPFCIFQILSLSLFIIPRMSRVLRHPQPGSPQPHCCL